MSFYAALIIFVVISCFVCLLLSVINSAADNSFYLIFLSFNGFIYTFGHLLKILAPTAQAALVGIRVQYVGLPLIAPMFYLFANSILREKQFSVKMRTLIALPSLVLALGFQVFRVFNLYSNRVTFMANTAFPHWELVMGPLQIFDMVYSYIFFFLSIGFIIKYYKSYHRYKKQQIHILLAALLVPVLTKAILQLPGIDFPYDVSPVTVAVSLGLLLYLVRHYNLLKVIPLARTQVIEQMQDALIICDARHHYLDANASAKEIFPHIKNLHPGDPLFADEGAHFTEEMQLDVGGALRTFKVTQTSIRQGQKTAGICILLHDMTEKQAMVNKLYDRATFDGLMKIFNRASFYDRGELALTDTNSEFALMMLDIDHFKEVNDLYGHSCGDMVLQRFAETLKKALRNSDLIGRVGGEEIVILMENIAAAPAQATARRLALMIENMKLEHHGESFRITVSIGIAHSEKGQPHQLETLLAQADEALYEVKNSGRNGCLLYKRTDFSNIKPA